MTKMRYTILFFIILAIGITGCGKDKVSMKPTLKFSEVNTTELRKGDILEFKLAFTTPGADLIDSIIVRKVLLNCTAGFIQGYPLPDLPFQTNQKGDIIVTYGYANDKAPQPIQKEPRDICGTDVDSAVFKFILMDRAGNFSDTATSPVILIY